jgi:hypothetical protein
MGRGEDGMVDHQSDFGWNVMEAVFAGCRQCCRRSCCCLRKTLIYHNAEGLGGVRVEYDEAPVEEN